MTIHDNSRAEYISRINRVMHYVDEHFCEPVNLGKLAEVANFSPFHFHRIFTAMTGETPTDFFVRIRTEKAAQQLNDSTSKNVSDIAYECGFSSMSVFARTFRKHFGMRLQTIGKQKNLMW